MVITEADGAEAEARRVAAELQDALADDAVAVHAPDRAGEVADLWRWRGSAAFAILAQRGGAFSEDIAVPLDRLRDVAHETLEIGARHDVPALSSATPATGTSTRRSSSLRRTWTRSSAPTRRATSCSSSRCASAGR